MSGETKPRASDYFLVTVGLAFAAALIIGVWIGPGFAVGYLACG